MGPLQKIFYFKMITMILWSVAAVSIITSYLKEDYILVGFYVGLLFTNAFVYTVFDEVEKRL